MDCSEVKMDLKLEGKTVLITGASKGIGRACADMLAQEGCSLHIAARHQEDLDRAKSQITDQYGVSVQTHSVDLSNGDQVIELIKACSDMDMLVNNAGAIPTGDLWQIEESKWRQAWDLKVFGYINMCREAYALMKSKGNGVIINVIGAGGERPNWNYIAGGSANAGLMAFTRALGGRSLNDGIRVLAVNPGLIKTERLESLFKTLAQTRLNDPEKWEELLPKEPVPGDPEDIANVVAFLLSDRAAYITGTVVTADGGFSAKT